MAGSFLADPEKRLDEREMEVGGIPAHCMRESDSGPLDGDRDTDGWLSHFDGLGTTWLALQDH
jgi:hypothetical protein